MISGIFHTLCCPDDGADVIQKGDYLECLKCHRQFSILADNLVEMLPSKFPDWNLNENENRKAEEDYKNLLEEQFAWDKKSNGWGYLHAAFPGYRAFVKREREKILELLNPSSESIAIDVSGGVGNYSIFLSDVVEFMVHCEVHIPSILTAYNRVKDKKDKMLFFRSTYLKLPFKSASFDCLICTDTLERGWNHEVQLLKEILRILKIGGKAVVDFHNLKWFRRNRNICEYKISKVKQILSEAGISEYSIYPFGYAPSMSVPTESLYTILDNVFKLFFPCIRHIVVFTKM